ncbi:MAG: SpoIID/LytB domain-containing protein [Oscillospiraceae bacterium]|nr:SpoIID/LytB domain-containing protein [Oscillospiraceae bacterium]
MKEQLPLKRIFIGLAACVTAGVAVTAAGTVNTAVLNLPEISSSYVLRSEAVWDDTYSAEASVVALNHEETNNNSSNITKLIDLTVSSSAFKAVMENQEEAGQPEQAETTEETAEETQEEYEVEEWWKAELSDYSETLEQQELIPTEIPVPEQPEAAEQPESEGSSANEPGIIQTPSVPAQSGTSVGAAEIRLPDTLTPNTVYFTSYGYGHGIGMSQNGANYYAKYGGYDYLQILEHYYPGTTIAYTPDAETETISVRGYSGSVVDIISMVCNAEIGSSFEVEAIKAQAVAAYTYVKHAGGSTSGMAIKPGPDQKIIDAVKSVLGQAVYYNGSYALTMFCASSGGATASNKDIIIDDIPYLRSVVSEYDAQYDSHYGEITSMSVDTLRYRIQSSYGITLSSSYGSWIQPEIGDGGYVRRVTIDGQKTVNGYDFARAIGLKTPKFSVYCN